MWGIIVREIYKDGKRYKTLDELEAAVKRAFYGVSKECVDNLANSILERCFEVHFRGGKSIQSHMSL